MYLTYHRAILWFLYTYHIYILLFVPLTSRRWSVVANPNPSHLNRGGSGPHPGETATTTAKEGILPYRTVLLPAAMGTTTTRRRGCGGAEG